MGPYLIQFLIDGEIIRKWASMTPPLVPRKGEKIIGEINTFRVAEVEYDYRLPDGVFILIYLERVLS